MAVAIMGRVNPFPRIPIRFRTLDCQRCGRRRNERDMAFLLDTETWAERWYCHEEYAVSRWRPHEITCWQMQRRDEAEASKPARYAGLPCPCCGSGKPDCARAGSEAERKRIHDEWCWVEYNLDLCPSCALDQDKD